ncbi:MAG: hypothetical protein H0T12_00355 [Actinobacteria bacterium]|nr:hypothetical protein [Actinomycetota bacterium]
MTLPRIAGLCAILAAIVGAVSAGLFLAAADWHFERVLRPALMIGAGSSRAQLLRWGALTDMLGYYLLLVPLFVCFPRELRRDRDGVAHVLGAAGVMYASFGAVAAVVLASAAPPLMSAYERSDAGARVGLKLAFRTVADAVATGVWQTLEVIPLGAWAIGTGLLVRSRSPGLGLVGVALGGVALIASATRMIQTGPLPEPLLMALAALFAVLFWVYVLWIANWFLRREPRVGGPDDSRARR